MSSMRLLAGALLVWSLTGCGEWGAGPQDPSADGNAARNAVAIYTDYTAATELFVEFAPLVVGQTSVFAAHVTRLEDFAPLEHGTLDVLLEENGQPRARFRVRDVARPGLFTPGVAPREAGRFELVVEIAADGIQARHELGAITVFAHANEARVERPNPEGDIEYLKEQQWSAAFATAPAGSRLLRPSVPGFATVRAPADGDASIHAPVEGYLGFAGNWHPGQQVEAEAALGYIVPRLGDGTDLASLSVALARARSEAALAERESERLEDLHRQGAVPERRLAEAHQRMEVARAELEAAQARLQQYERGDGRAGLLLRAPIAGEIIEASALPGSFVRAGQLLFRIATPERRWLEVRVPEHYAAGLGRASGAWFDAPGGETTVLDAGTGARVVQVGSTIDPRTRTASVIVEYPAARSAHPIGARFAANVFADERHERLAVPRDAVVDDGGRAVVYVQVGGETFQRRPVELGIVDGTYVEVVRGIAPGERVVTEGAYYVRLAAAGEAEIGHGHTH